MRLMLVWAMAGDVTDGHGGHGQDPEKHSIVDLKGGKARKKTRAKAAKAAALTPTA